MNATTTTGPGMVKVTCVRPECGASFYILASASKVKCTVCRAEWPRAKGGKVLMQRGAK